MSIVQQTYPYELLVRFLPQSPAVVGGSHYKNRTIVADGSTVLADNIGMATDIQALTGADAAAVADIMGGAAAAALGQVAALTTQLSQAHDDTTLAQSELAQAQAQSDAWQAQAETAQAALLLATNKVKDLTAQVKALSPSADG